RLLLSDLGPLTSDRCPLSPVPCLLSPRHLHHLPLPQSLQPLLSRIFSLPRFIDGFPPARQRPSAERLQPVREILIQPLVGQLIQVRNRLPRMRRDIRRSNLALRRNL